MMISWIFDAGNSFETKKGVAAAVNSLLKNGTSKRSAFEINEHFEYYGAWLNRHSNHESADLTLHCLNKHVGELLPVVAELITDSIFPHEELDIYKKNAQQRLQVSLKKSDFVAGRLIDAYLYGPAHPYGVYMEQEDYQQLQRDDLVDFYKQQYLGGACRILIAGKLPADIIDRLEASFGRLAIHAPEKSVALPAPAIIPAAQKKYNIVNDPNGVQGSIRIARNFPNRHHPDFQKVQVLNNVFGGFFGSRLMANIREDKGYTYSPFSDVDFTPEQALWTFQADVTTEHTGDSLKEVFKEIRRMQTEAVPADEAKGIRTYMAGLFAIQNSTSPSLVNTLATRDTLGLPGDWTDRYVPAVLAVDPAAMMASAKAGYPLDKLVLVAVGDLKTVEPQLKALPELQGVEFETVKVP